MTQQDRGVPSVPAAASGCAPHPGLQTARPFRPLHSPFPFGVPLPRVSAPPQGTGLLTQRHVISAPSSATRGPPPLRPHIPQVPPGHPSPGVCVGGGRAPSLPPQRPPFPIQVAERKLPPASRRGRWPRTRGPAVGGWWARPAWMPVRLQGCPGGQEGLTWREGVPFPPLPLLPGGGSSAWHFSRGGDVRSRAAPSPFSHLPALLRSKSGPQATRGPGRRAVSRAPATGQRASWEGPGSCGAVGRAGPARVLLSSTWQALPAAARVGAPG